LGRLRVLSGREVCRILAENGFIEVRRRGSHIAMQKRTADTTITVPVPDHDELKRGTLLSIIRQSGLPRTLFEVEQR
jgi:predicted RNA binding protein YcfA (HicA-like mRNA interferase family)